MVSGTTDRGSSPFGRTTYSLISNFVVSSTTDRAVRRFASSPFGRTFCFHRSQQMVVSGSIDGRCDVSLRVPSGAQIIL